jgi:hypothetical protein
MPSLHAVQAGTNNTPGALQNFRKSRVWSAITTGVNYDIHKVIDTDQSIHDLHEHAEVFDHKAETSFKYLQASLGQGRLGEAAAGCPVVRRLKPPRLGAADRLGGHAWSDR